MNRTDIESASSRAPASTGSLGVWDVCSLMVGIVVGTAIFKLPPLVLANAGDSTWMLILWGVGGLIAFCGALCYCELASTWPSFGAEYVYLSRAYGRRVGFLFAWTQTCAVITGNVGAMAFVFTDYAAQLWPALGQAPALVSALAVLSLAGLQLIGLTTGKTVQNLLTAAKVLSLGALMVCGLFLTSGAPAGSLPSAEPRPVSLAGIGMALVFVLYAYGGWNDATTVTPEVRDCRRNMPRALLLGLGFIILLYLVMNLAYLRALGEEGLIASRAPAADVILQTLGPRFSHAMSLMIMVSALGAINGMLFSGCRLLAAVGRDVPALGGWNRWNARNVPGWSLLTLTGISLLLIGLVGTERGRLSVDSVLQKMKLSPTPWEQFDGGFNTLVSATSPIFLVFFLLAGASVIVLRLREPDRPRPFRTPGFPVTPLIFMTGVGYMAWSSAQYAGRLTLLLFPVLCLGLLAAFVLKGTAPKGDHEPL